MAAAPFSTPVKLLSPLNRSRPDCRRKTGVFIATWRSSTHFRHRHLLRKALDAGNWSAPEAVILPIRILFVARTPSTSGTGRSKRLVRDPQRRRRRTWRAWPGGSGTYPTSWSPAPSFTASRPGRAYGSRLLPQPGLGSGMVGPSSSPGRPGPLGLRPHRAQRRANFCAAGSTPGRWYSLQSERRSLWGSGTAFPMNRERHGEYRRRREFVAVVWDRAVGGARGFAPG